MSDPTAAHVPVADGTVDHAPEESTVPGGDPGPRPPDGFENPQGFVLYEEVGRGGMGVVYRSRDLSLGREVAVKILSPKYPPRSPAAARFLDEARITSQLQHPGIPAIYQVGELTDARPYLAMKLIHGRTLEDLIRSGAVPDKSAVFEAISQALGYAHAHGVIHRDLKPANVMVGAFAEVQVMDWGLAKVLPGVGPGGPGPRKEPGIEAAARDADAGSTLAGSVLGTPAYMAPEQAAGQTDRVGRTSDVFGLGAVLCALLTGRPPFSGATGHEARRNAARGDTADAAARLDASGADPGLVDLCKRLAFDPAARPADADAVAAAVAALRREADERAKLAQVDRARAEVYAAEVSKRRRVWVGLAVSLFIGLAASAGTAVWANDRRVAAERAEADAERRRLEAVAAQEKEAEERRIAVDQTRLANGVKDFLQFDVLRLADPGTQMADSRATGLAYDADLKLRDVVIRAAKAIDGRFADRPAVEAELRWAIGSTLLGMGRPDLAVPQYEALRAVRDRQFGADHGDTLISVNGLGIAYGMTGRHRESVALFEKVVPALRAKFGPDHPETLSALGNLAIGYAAVGRHPEALAGFLDVFRRRHAVLGPDHRDTLIAMSSVATEYAAAGRPADALKLHDEVLALRREKLGPDHPDTLTSMANLAATYADLGRNEDAVKLDEEALALRREKLGKTHPDTLTSLRNLACGYVALGRRADALKLREEAYSLAVQAHGPDSPEAIAAGTDTVESLRDLRRPADAIKRIDELLPPAARALAAGKQIEPGLRKQLLGTPLELARGRGDAAACRQTAEWLRAGDASDAADCYDAACYWAVTAAVQAKETGSEAADRARNDADRAVEWLKKAVAKGYADRGHAEVDPDLAFIRSRDDVRGLIASMPKSK